MSESFTEPDDRSTAESDVESNDDQVEPGSDDEFVGRVAGQDEGSAEEQGSERRAVADPDVS